MSERLDEMEWMALYETFKSIVDGSNDLEFDGNPFAWGTEGCRVTLRRGPASVAVESSGAPRGVGAELLYFARSHGVAISGAVPGLGLGVGVALNPVRWVDWGVWIQDPDNPRHAREIGFYATASYAMWRLWVEPHVPSAMRRNTFRAGHASWGRLLGGRLHEEVVAEERHEQCVRLPEGAYPAQVFTRTYRCSRERLPWSWKRSVTTVECRTGIASPNLKAPSGEHVDYIFVLDDIATPEDATAEVRRRVLRARGHDVNWRPARRFRRVVPSQGGTSAVSMMTWLGVPRGAAEPADAPSHAPEATPERPDLAFMWETRDPLTGLWTEWGRCATMALPADSIVEKDPGLAGLFIAMASLSSFATLAFATCMGGLDRR